MVPADAGAVGPHAYEEPSPAQPLLRDETATTSEPEALAVGPIAQPLHHGLTAVLALILAAQTTWIPATGLTPAPSPQALIAAQAALEASTSSSGISSSIGTSATTGVTRVLTLGLAPLLAAALAASALAWIMCRLLMPPRSQSSALTTFLSLNTLAISVAMAAAYVMHLFAAPPLLEAAGNLIRHELAALIGTEAATSTAAKAALAVPAAALNTARFWFDLHVLLAWMLPAVLALHGISAALLPSRVRFDATRPRARPTSASR
ncbi:MAG: hypothetical protein AAFR04_03430 [Pseudomonadota bacterium]